MKARLNCLIVQTASLYPKPMTSKTKTLAAVPSQRYSKPPILEAVIEFRLSEPLSARTVGKVSRKLKRGYSTTREQKEVTFQLNVVQGQTHVNDEITYFEHASDDQTDVLVVKPENLIWSRRAPYEGWQSFINRVHRELQVALETIGYCRIARIGLRYINRIDVPSDNPPQSRTFRYEDYITINLTLPPKLDPIGGYLWRIERQFPELALNATLQSGTLIPELPEMASFLLDVDVFTTEELPVKIDDIAPKLEEMRKLKNELFELSISDVARRVFE
jgi:uncharacterized protein (TIGR04255 family)